MATDKAEIVRESSDLDEGTDKENTRDDGREKLESVCEKKISHKSDLDSSTLQENLKVISELSWEDALLSGSQFACYVCGSESLCCCDFLEENSK